MNTNEWFLLTKEIIIKTDHDVPRLESNII